MHFVQHLSDPVWWGELYIHFIAICSALTFVLAPAESWAKENLSPEQYKKFQSVLDLIGKYGALNNRKPAREIWDDVERQKQLGEKAQAAGGNG